MLAWVTYDTYSTHRSCSLCFQWSRKNQASPMQIRPFVLSLLFLASPFGVEGKDRTPSVPAASVSASISASASTSSSASASAKAQPDEASLLEHGHYTNKQGQEVHSPAHTKNGKAPAGASAKCSDGTFSFSKSHRGTCSHHGGVTEWLN